MGDESGRNGGSPTQGYCPGCGEELPGPVGDPLRYCPNCGRRLEQRAEGERQNQPQATPRSSQTAEDPGRPSGGLREVEESAARTDSRSWYAYTSGLFFTAIILFMGGAIATDIASAIAGGLLVFSFILGFASIATMYLDLRRLNGSLWDTRPLIWVVGAVLLWIVVLPLYVIKRHSHRTGVSGPPGPETDVELSSGSPSRLDRQHRLSVDDGEMEEWFDSLAPEKQNKVRDLLETAPSSGGGAALLHACNYLGREDRELKIELSQKAIEWAEDPVDRHFAYNTLIQALRRSGRGDEALRRSIQEIERFDEIRGPLKEAMGGQLPPSIPARVEVSRNLDRVHALGYDPGDLLTLLHEKGLLSDSELQSARKEWRLEQTRRKGLELLKEGEVQDGLANLKEVYKEGYLSPNQAADAAEILVDSGRPTMAFEWYRRAIQANPTASGFRRDMTSLAGDLGREDELEQLWIEALEESRRESEEWWRKRDLADEFSKLGAHDQAWSLYQESLMLLWEDGRHADTVYPNMAKALEREKRHKRALLHYLLARAERLRSGGSDRQITRDGVSRCLDKLGVTTDPDVLLSKISSETDHEEAERMVRGVLE